MATAQCACGKRIGVSDALIGKTIKCPQCGEKVVVSASAQAARKAPVQSGRESIAQHIHLSGGLVTTVVLFVLIGSGVLALKLGPMRAWSQWQAMSQKAEGEVNDVVSFALQAYLSEAKLYNPTKSNHRPSVDGSIDFDMPWMVMSLPEKVGFVGLSDQGKFAGYYDTRTGEIDADIGYGGGEVGGLIMTKGITGVFHITGRDVDGNPQAESDGNPLKIFYPPPDEQGKDD